MGSTVRDRLVSTLAVLVAVVVATLVRVALAPIVGPAVPFATYLLAGIVLSWYRGFWPAAVFVPLAAWAGSRYVLMADASGILSTGRSIRATLLGFALVSLTVMFLIDFLRRTSQRAQAAEQSQTIVAAQNARLVTQLQQSNDELRRTNRDLELFAYSASHDLQEPLRTIALFAQLMKRRQPANGDIDPLHQIITAAQRMDTLMHDIRSYLNTARPATETIPLIDTSHTLAEVLERLHVSILSSGAIITHNDLPTIRMHEDRLAQVLQNLIGNAIKYRRDEPPRIHIDGRPTTDEWVFSVADNGIGIDATYTERIFELFKRLHGQDQYQGSGIGLSLCQRILEQYGGRIWMDQSTLGVGTTFIFAIPFKAPVLHAERITN
jgi:signal transduction histidine kinase